MIATLKHQNVSIGNKYLALLCLLLHYSAITRWKTHLPKKTDIE